MIFEKAAAAITAEIIAVSSVQAVSITAADKSEEKASISVQSIVLTHDEAAEKPVQTVKISVSGAEEKYAAVGFHVYWDSELTPVKNTEGEILTAGKAIRGMSCEQRELENGVFVTASSGYNSGKDGVIFSLKLMLPELSDDDRDYFVRVAFEDNSKTGDLFMNYEEDESGALMQQQVVSSLKDGGITVLGIPETSTTTTSTTTTSTTKKTTESTTTSSQTTTATTSATKTTTSQTGKTTTTTVTTTSTSTTTTVTTSPISPKNIGDLDKNGMVMATDASMLLVFYADLSDGGRTATAEELYICDVDRSGKIEAGDASMILSYYASISGEEKTTFLEYLKAKGIKV